MLILFKQKIESPIFLCWKTEWADRSLQTEQNQNFGLLLQPNFQCLSMSSSLYLHLLTLNDQNHGEALGVRIIW